MAWSVCWQRHRTAASSPRAVSWTSDPTYQGGVTMYAIDLRRGDEFVRRETSNSMAPATKAEAERLIALAEHLADLEAWLPDGCLGRDLRRALCRGELPPEGHSVQAARRRLSVRAHGPVRRPVADARIARGLRRVSGLEQQPLGAGTSSRCGLLTSAEATAVRRALAAAPWGSMGDRQQAELDWSDVGHVTVVWSPSSPRTQLDCEVDLSAGHGRRSGASAR